MPRSSSPNWKRRPSATHRQKMNRILYLHGFASSPASNKARFFAAHPRAAGAQGDPRSGSRRLRASHHHGPVARDRAGCRGRAGRPDGQQSWVDISPPICRTASRGVARQSYSRLHSSSRAAGPNVWVPKRSSRTAEDRLHRASFTTARSASARSSPALLSTMPCATRITPVSDQPAPDLPRRR